MGKQNVFLEVVVFCFSDFFEIIVLALLKAWAKQSLMATKLLIWVSQFYERRYN